jgi:pyruvate decarboxylase
MDIPGSKVIPGLIICCLFLLLTSDRVGVGAVVTTFGVGELSAINAIAGAYAERAPVVHIVGTPTRASQESHARIHHTFNDGDYQRFDSMQEHVTVAQVSLNGHRTATSEIDWALLQCVLHSRPVRIAVPVDMVASLFQQSSWLWKSRNRFRHP